MNPFRLILASLLALAALAAALPALAPAAVVTRDVAKSPAAVRDYWTKARMRKAEPVPVESATPATAIPAPAEDAGAPTYVAPAAPGGSGAATLERGTGTTTAARGSGVATPIADPSAPGVRTHGKVFFTTKGGLEPGDYVCSGTAVASRNKSLVWTAGHCVYDVQDLGGKSVNFMFAPAWHDGEAPFGYWTAKELGTTRQWKRDGNLRFDMGAVVVARNAGRRLQAVVGARGIGFDQPRDQTYSLFGFPVQQGTRFEGSRVEWGCVSPNRGADLPGGDGPKTIRTSCDMSGGSSGGGWVSGGILLSETSYGYGTSPYLYGPYLSQTAKKLYKRLGR